MATTETPTAPRSVTDHATEAIAWLNAFAGRPEDLQPAETIAYAQVHATLAMAQAVEANTETGEALIQVAEAILSDLPASLRPRTTRVVEHRGYTVAAQRLLPGLWAVDVYYTADPDRGEGPAAFLSCGTGNRAMNRGVELAVELAAPDADKGR